MPHFRYSLRRLARQPGFTATVLGLIALCLGANLLTYAVLHGLLLKPLPFSEPERLFTVYNSYPQAGLPRNSASVRDYFTRRQGGIAAFESVSSFRYGSEAVGPAGQVSRRPTLQITPEFFDTLGVHLAMGRSFNEAEMLPGAERPVIVSQRYWRNELGGKPDALGQELEIGGRNVFVVGVLPESFRFLSSRADLFLPLVSNEEQRALNALHGEHAEMLVRLRPGVSAEAALQQLNAHYAVHAQGYPWAREVEQAGFAMHIAPLHADHIRQVRPMILLLQAAAFGLLLVGTANVVNLLLLRQTSTTTDQGLRWALGARGVSLLGPVLIEIMLLSVFGATLAWAVAHIGLGLLQGWASAHLPLGATLQMGAETVAMAAMAAIVLMLALGLILALVMRISGVHPGWGRSRGGGADRRTQRLRQRFAIAQIALAFVLLAGASALSLGLQEALRSNPGFDPADIVVAELALPATRYPSVEERLRFSERTLEQFQAQPGIEAVAVSTNLPVRGRGSFNDRQAIHVVGFEATPGRAPLLHNRYGITGDYFQSFGIRLISGRYLEASDASARLRVAVVDEDFARFYWPQGSALGQRLFNGPDAGTEAEAFTVVGVVASVRQEDLGSEIGNGTLYLPYSHLPHAELFVSLRARSPAGTVRTTDRSRENAEAWVPRLRTGLIALDPALALDTVKPMQARIEDTLLAHQGPALLSSLFAAASILMAAVGSFGLLGFMVAQGRREIGLRLALGAQRGQIARRYLALGLKVFAIGIVLGVLASTLLWTVLRDTLLEVPASGPGALLAASVGLAIVGLAACLLPALKAAGTSPLEAIAER